MTPDQKISLAEAIRLLKESYVTIRHAQVFIETREKMHPDGQALYRKHLGELKEFLGK